MKKILSLFILLVMVGLFIVCILSNGKGDNKVDLRVENLRNDIYYEIFICFFVDSDGDGIGDFNGVI